MYIPAPGFKDLTPALVYGGFDSGSDLSDQESAFVVLAWLGQVLDLEWAAR